MMIRKMILCLAIGAVVACTSKQDPIAIHMIGDSTMANKKVEVYPETGWGQVFESCFDDQVVVSNHALNGRSSKSFLDEGRWQHVLDSLKKGDYVFIQFGHNDQKYKDSTRYTDPFGQYVANLERYVRQAREKEAIPILLTSIVRRKFDETGQLVDTHQDYPQAVRQVAQRMNVRLIDLQQLTGTLVQSLGDEPSKAMYLWTEPTERFPEGRQDDTHLGAEGAEKVARLVAVQLADMDCELARHVQLKDSDSL